MSEPLHAGHIVSFGHRDNELIAGEGLGQILHVMLFDRAGWRRHRLLRQHEILNPAAAFPKITQRMNEGSGIPIR
ncbi:MAG: hypothetical protein RJB58_890 [Pseudomonadota bacterium]